MQRSEGGALGIGGGGGGAGGGLMSGSGVKGALVRTTIIFGAIFFHLQPHTDHSGDPGKCGRPDRCSARAWKILRRQRLRLTSSTIEGLEDILNSGDESLLEDPLSGTPTETPATDQPAPTTNSSSEDPLATEPTDPQ